MFDYDEIKLYYYIIKFNDICNKQTLNIRYLNLKERGGNYGEEKCNRRIFKIA